MSTFDLPGRARAVAFAVTPLSRAFRPRSRIAAEKRTVSPSRPRWYLAAGRQPRGRGGFARFVQGDDDAQERDAESSAARLPSPETACACGSGKTYLECCRRFHTDAVVPPVALDLLRSRYSAYAYRLPAYIMRTTHESTAERDRTKWRREILEFSKEYRFVDGVECIEQNMTSADTTTILFRAKLRRRTQPVSFMEMSKFVRENSQWYYLDGKLVDVEDDE